MQEELNQNTLHRTAKYFMDSGRVDSAVAAVELLHRFGLTILVGKEVCASPAHQAALLTLINMASRTLLGGVEVVGTPEVMSCTPLAPNCSLRAAVQSVGGRLADKPRNGWPAAVIGTLPHELQSGPAWQLTWEGWRGGVIPLLGGARLADDNNFAIAPQLAAAVCAAEVFAFHAGDHDLAGKRSAGLSLWHPSVDWLSPDPTAPRLAYLPSRLWIIGLGNLGQAFAWLLASLPYSKDKPPVFVLQDFDRVSPANQSTSLLVFDKTVRQKKTRVVANWLEARGIETILEERHFGPKIIRTADEPGAALCGVDNGLARAALEGVGFELVVEAGLGAGPQGFRNISMHTFPATRRACDLWSGGDAADVEVKNKPAYEALRREGLDECGLTQLAKRTVAVPFVSVIAGCLVISEILRRLHSGEAIEVASLSALALEGTEIVRIASSPYSSGHIELPAETTAAQGLQTVVSDPSQTPVSDKDVRRGDCIRRIDGTVDALA